MASTFLGKISSSIGFFVGDPSYALDAEIYRLWGERNYEDGITQVEEMKSEYACLGTKWGDGYFGSSIGANFPVDSGTIALIPLEIVSEDKWQKLQLNGFIHQHPGSAEIGTDRESGEIDVILPGNCSFTIYTDEEESDDENDDWGDGYDEEEDDEEEDSY